MKQIEQHLVALCNERYEDKARVRLPDLFYQACREGQHPIPRTITLVRTDRPGEGQPDWNALHQSLGVDFNSTLRDCDFLYEIEWPAEAGLPNLWLAGEISITIDTNVLEKAAGHWRDLEAADKEVRTLVVGTGEFTDKVETRGGPDAVAAAVPFGWNVPRTSTTWPRGAMPRPWLNCFPIGPHRYGTGPDGRSTPCPNATRVSHLHPSGRIVSTPRGGAAVSSSGS